MQVQSHDPTCRSYVPRLWKFA